METKSFEHYKELGRRGTTDDLNKLIDYYLSDSQTKRRNAKKVLEKSSHFAVCRVLDKRISECHTYKRYRLSILCILIDRKKYLKFYLETKDYIPPNVESNIDSNEISDYHRCFYKRLTSSNTKWSNDEKRILQDYIIEKQDFNKSLLLICMDYNTDEFLFRLFDLIKGHEADKNLKTIFDIFQQNLDFLDLIQEEIRNLIKQDPSLVSVIGKFLNLSIQENINVLLHHSCSFIYDAVAQNVWFDNTCPDQYPINAAYLIAQNKPLQYEEKSLLQKEIDEGKASCDFLENLSKCEYIMAEKALIKKCNSFNGYSDSALQSLMRIKSNFAYSKIIGILVTTENLTERYKCAVRLISCFPEKSDSILGVIKGLQDEKLFTRIQEKAGKISLTSENISTSSTFDEKEEFKVTIVPSNTIISDLVYDLCKKINAVCLKISVGFAFSSGLKMFTPVFEYIKKNGGSINLVVGSLQNCETAQRQTKIDRATVCMLNKMCNENGFSLFTYQDTFFHGKFYYVEGKEKAYAIIGSSNISKTAYLNNKELDLLIQIDEPQSDKNIYRKWFQSFLTNCQNISNINEELFEDNRWNSELDVYTTKYIKKIQVSEIRRKIKELSDEETKARLNLWMTHNPAEIYTELGIPALSEYIMFLFPKHSLAVFESFEPGNAYYSFYYTSIDELLHKIATLTKTQMMKYSSFVTRGYHLQNSVRLEESILQLFNQNNFEP